LLLFLSSLVVIPLAILRATWKPLWFDEILTRQMCRLPSMAVVIQALFAGADGQPPAFYLVTRACVAVLGDRALALRLPGMVGMFIACVALFRMASRMATRIWGAAAVAFFLTTYINRYIVEGRPYGLMIGASAMALLCWLEYAQSERRLWVLGLFFSLGLAVSFHYYGFLLAIPLGVAECVRTWENRRVDPWVWSALSLGVLPLPFHYEVVRYSLKHYSSGAWNSPDQTSLLATYQGLILKGVWAGLFLVLALAIGALIPAETRSKQDSTTAPRASEVALWIAVLALPLAGFVLAVAVTGMITPRYLLATNLGMAVILAALGNKLSRRSALTGTIMLVLLGGQFLLRLGTDVRISSPTRPGRRTFSALSLAQRDDLPLVVAEATTFLDWYNAAPPRVPPRVLLTDDAAELKFTGMNSFSVQMPAGVAFFGWPVYAWKDFTAAHRSFLVVWTKSLPGWILQKAREDGGNARLLQTDGSYALYLVELPVAGR
jgi:hypothetical protein